MATDGSAYGLPNVPLPVTLLPLRDTYTICVFTGVLKNPDEGFVISAVVANVYVAAVLFGKLNTQFAVAPVLLSVAVTTPLLKNELVASRTDEPLIEYPAVVLIVAPVLSVVTTVPSWSPDEIPMIFAVAPMLIVLIPWMKHFVAELPIRIAFDSPAEPG